jgi:hypothetical protein
MCENRAKAHGNRHTQGKVKHEAKWMYKKKATKERESRNMKAE